MTDWWVGLDTWTIVDSRTGQPVTVTSFFTEEGALEQIESWRERDRRGKRPDVHDMMPYLEPKLVRKGR